MKTRIDYIDGLRAVAVLLVVIDHIAWHSHRRPPDALNLLFAIPWQSGLWHISLEGAHGVDLFFVLSGFCLAYPFLLEIAHNGTVRLDVTHFFAKRVVRILPPYYAALLIFGITRIVQHYATISDLLRQASFTTLHTASINEAFWTLAIEFRWYIMFPVILWLWISSPRIFLLAIAAIVVVFNAGLVRLIDVGTLPGFMLGIIAADTQIKCRPVQKYAALGFVLLLATSILLERPLVEADALTQLTQITWQLCAFFLVLAAGYNGALVRILSNKVAVIVGLASYSIYLTHAPIIGGVSNLLRYSPVIFYILGSASLSIAFAFAFWWYIERPFVHGTLKRSAVDAIRNTIGKVSTPLHFKTTILLKAGNLRAEIGASD